VYYISHLRSVDILFYTGNFNAISAGDRFKQEKGAVPAAGMKCMPSLQEVMKAKACIG